MFNHQTLREILKEVCCFHFYSLSILALPYITHYALRIASHYASHYASHRITSHHITSHHITSHLIITYECLQRSIRTGREYELDCLTIFTLPLKCSYKFISFNFDVFIKQNTYFATTALFQRFFHCLILSI